MGQVEEIQGKEVSQTGEPIGSVAPNYQTNQNQPPGRPWSTGLFDCHENQTNGKLPFFSWFDDCLLYRFKDSVGLNGYIILCLYKIIDSFHM